jgi:hypothetical protein
MTQKSKSSDSTHRLRSTAQVVLLVVATLCAIVAPPAVWSRNLVLNTDKYVETLKPLAADSGVQDAVIAAIDKAVDAQINIEDLVRENLPRAAALAAPIEQAAETLVNTVVTRFVRSDAFQTIWVTINRVAHTQIVRLLTGNGKVLQIDNGGRVVLNLQTAVDEVRNALASLGLKVAHRVAPVGATLQIAQLHGLAKARSFTKLLDNLADWLPWIMLVLFLASIAVAVRRRRAVAAAAWCLAGAMLLIGLLLLVGRHYYLTAITSDDIPRSVAMTVYDTLVRFLRDGIRILLAIGLLVVLIAWLAGQSHSARSTRGLPRRLGRSPATTRAVEVVRGHAHGVEIGIVALVALILVLWSNPSGWTVLTLVIVGALLVGLVAVLAARRPSRI